jgi:hypothetical protein
MHTFTPFRLSAVGLLAVFAAACADAPTAPGDAGLPSLAVGDPTTAIHTRSTARLCKYGTAGDFNVTTTLGADYNVSLAAGECQIIAERIDDPNTSTDDINTVTVTEIPSAAHSVASIKVTTGTANSSDVYPTSTVVVDYTSGETSASGTYGLENGTLIEFTNTPTPPPPGGGEGCTPGYWKQTQHFDSWPAPYLPGHAFSSVFADAFPGMTLQQVAAQGGGGLKALGRHTVAALLNAASSGVDYDYSVADVIADFNAAFASGDYETQKNLFAVANEQGCPLN